VLVIGWLGWQTITTPHRLDRTRARQVRAEELRGAIMRLDETLTMSARLGAATGDPAWESRYRANEPVLDSVLREATRLLPMAARTDSANARLVAMEHAAFALGRVGRAPEGAALLTSAAYARHKRVYADGMTAFSRALRAQQDSAILAEHGRSRWAPAAVLLGVLAAVAGWVVSLGALWSWRGQLERQVAKCTAANAALTDSLAARDAADRRFRAVFDSTAVGIVLLDDARAVVAANAAFAAFVGRAADTLVGVPAASLSPPEDADVTRQPVRELRAGRRDQVTVEKRYRHADGGVRWGLLTLSRLDLQGETGCVGVVQDVTDRKRLESELTRQALHDPLTGLANRALFHDRVAHALARAGRRPASTAVLYLDLDDFKRVNDTLGHAAGDALLVAVAERLLNATRGCDTVARLGGDEFAVLLDHVPDEGAGVVVERVLAALARPVAVGLERLVPRGSLGLAYATPDMTADDLVRDADVAMYHAKRQGAGGHALFVPAMREAVVHERALEAALRSALGADEFRLVYQPILALAAVAAGEAAAGDPPTIIGAEALVRWHHPTLGVVSPADFIPLAERTGLIVEIGRWVLRAACREAAAWPPGADGPLTITVNVSARQLADAGLTDDVAAALAASGLPAARLLLEITESTLAENTEATLARLHALKALGVRLAIDDFGTGYSSLAYLQRFPVDVLKIDKAFIDGVAHGGSEAAIARAVVALGDALGLRTVAEGVETAAQCAELRALGCGYGQGYLFARPLRADAFVALLPARRAAPAATEG
jgi:diguanylate cyclase (GGDEF)-like protein/PAS domain S-box-containing protein